MTYRNLTFGLNESDVVGLTEEQRTAIEFQMCVSVAELGPWKYANFRHPRWEYHYGYAQIMSGAFVVKDIPLSYLNHEILDWKDHDFGINETTGCYAKALAQLIGNGAILPYTVLTRQRFTSVRFKFFPGVLANCVMKYEIGQPKCGGNVIPPDDTQGNPPDPANHSHDPTKRPADQPGDGFDPSPNDGQTPEPGQQPPPSPGIYPPDGQWFGVYAGQDGFQSCAEFSGTQPIPGATDPDYRPILNITGTAPCPNTYKGQVIYKGNVALDNLSDFSTYEFIWQPSQTQP